MTLNKSLECDKYGDPNNDDVADVWGEIIDKPGLEDYFDQFKKLDFSLNSDQTLKRSENCLKNGFRPDGHPVLLLMSLDPWLRLDLNMYHQPEK